MQSTYICTSTHVFVLVFVMFSSVFEHLHSNTFGQNAKEVDTAVRPSGHCGQGLGAVRALWSAWQALGAQSFFFGGSA